MWRFIWNNNKIINEREFINNLKNNLKEIDEDGKDDENNIKNKNDINVFYFISKNIHSFRNLFNIILSRNENDNFIILCLKSKKYFQYLKIK